MEQLKKTKINDMFVTDGVIRPDGLLEKDMYVVQVKTPAELKGDWDFYKILKTLKREEAYGKLADFSLPAGQEINLRNEARMLPPGRRHAFPAATDRLSPDLDCRPSPKTQADARIGSDELSATR